ncbi:MAG: S41 family peptidase [Oscillospiraceae bacterium]|nr:S41 family peptidase [Oscillospiraceae bacterium]MBQ6493055.1 S41 family peptidase [Erysipelotrichaceae bacterium]
MEKEENKVYVGLEKVPLKSEREEIKKRRRKTFLIFLICFLCFVVGVVSTWAVMNSLHPAAAKGGVFEEIKTVMERYWLYSDEYEDLDEELNNKAFYGMTSFEDDPYTSYMSKEEMQEFADSINKDYVGIGVEYVEDYGIPLVTKVFKDSPAEKAGILAGDFIISIDSQKTEGLDATEIKERVVGTAGTEVLIGIQRGNEKMQLSVIRGVINSTVFAYTDGDCVIMEINSFGESTANEVERYLEELEDYTKIIIDVRNNGGGYQTAVRDVCRLFIGSNKVYLRQKGIDGNELVDYTTGGKVFDNFEDIVILINENTASAAEVFAIVLKEQLDDVTLVGNTTYGKGVIQINRRLSDGGIMKLTAYYWYSPNGVSIDKTGIDPDVFEYMPDIYYEYYYAMEDDEKYEIDSVSASVKTAQMALDYLGYDIDRTDGYFDQSFAEALIRYKGENNLPAIAVLDQETFRTIVSSANRELHNNPDKDTQLQKALEVIHEN